MSSLTLTKPEIFKHRRKYIPYANFTARIASSHCIIYKWAQLVITHYMTTPNVLAAAMDVQITSFPHQKNTKKAFLALSAISWA